VPFRERDIFKQRLSREELLALLGPRSPGEVFSWKSVRARKAGWSPGSLSEDEMVRLIIEDPTLVRRPLVRVDDELIVGFDRQRLEALLAR